MNLYAGWFVVRGLDPKGLDQSSWEFHAKLFDEDIGEDDLLVHFRMYVTVLCTEVDGECKAYGNYSAKRKICDPGDSNCNISGYPYEGRKDCYQIMFIGEAVEGDMPLIGWMATAGGAVGTGVATWLAYESKLGLFWLQTIGAAGTAAGTAVGGGLGWGIEYFFDAEYYYKFVLRVKICCLCDKDTGNCYPSLFTLNHSYELIREKNSKEEPSHKDFYQKDEWRRLE
jgi:hypothetical protein